MRAVDLITLQIYVNNQWIDYTDGLINLEIIRGVEEYTGPLSQPDVGQLTLKSRNTNLDPYNNNNIKYNAKIRVNAGGTRIFTGRIEGIEVEYGPRTEPTIVTINSFDLIGTMYKHILPEDFIDDYESWSTVTLLNELSATGEVAEWQNYIISTDGTAYAEGPIELNTTVFDALNVRSKTDLGFYFANARNEIEYYRRDSDDALHPFNARAAEVTFDYDGNGESYKAISLNDGFEKIANEIIITGVGPTDTTKVVVTANDSVDLWGKSSAEVTLATDDNTNLQIIGNEVLTEMAEPIREIYEITWDATLDHEAAKNIDIMDNIHINHVINQNTSIDRKYGVIGIKHEINYDDWLVTYVLRNYDYQATSIPNPIIVINPESGGAEVDFNFSYTHPNPELITGQSWDLDDGFTSNAASTTINYLTSGTKTIILTINTIYGYTKTTSVELEVGIAPPIASFSYIVDANNVYTFAFTGSGLGSVFWDFGDGTSSTETNPSKFYVTSATRTVTVTATNIFGFDTYSQSISTFATTKIPIRYVRFRWIGGLAENWYTYNSSNPQFLEWSTSWGREPLRYFNLKFYDTGNAELGAGYSLVDYKDINGFFTTTPNVLDEYNRTQITPSSEIEEKLKGANGIYPVTWDTGTYSQLPYSLSDLDKQARIHTTFDLGTYYYSFKEPKITLATINNISGFGQNTRILVDVSWNNQDWRYIGELTAPGYASGTTKTTTFTPVATAPFTFTNTSAPTVEYNYTPIRYIKLLFNTPSPSTATFFMLRDFFAFGGRGTASNPAGAVTGIFDNYWGQGGINIQDRTGADYTLDSTNSSGVTLITKTYTTAIIGTITQSLINQGTSGITALNNRDVNAKGNISNGLTWQETTGEKTFTIDFGQPIYKLTGFRLNTGRYFANGFFEFNPMDNGYTVTISHSVDNINYTTIGTFTLDYTQPNGKFIISTNLIRVAGDATDAQSETKDIDYYFRPVHSGTTWQQVNHLLLPNGTVP